MTRIIQRGRHLAERRPHALLMLTACAVRSAVYSMVESELEQATSIPSVIDLCFRLKRLLSNLLTFLPEPFMLLIQLCPADYCMFSKGVNDSTKLLASLVLLRNQFLCILPVSLKALPKILFSGSSPPWLLTLRQERPFHISPRARCINVGVDSVRYMISAPLLNLFEVTARVCNIKTGNWKVARRTAPAPIDR